MQAPKSNLMPVGDESKRHKNFLTDQQRLLPLANIRKIMKDVLHPQKPTQNSGLDSVYGRYGPMSRGRNDESAAGIGDTSDYVGNTNNKTRNTIDVAA